MAATNPQFAADDLSDEPLPPDVVWLTPAEGRALFDEKVLSTLGISGDEFIRRADAGAYDAIEEDETGRKIVRLMMAIPFARPTSVGG